MDLVYATFSLWKSGAEKPPASAASAANLRRKRSGPLPLIIMNRSAPSEHPISYRRDCKKQAQTLTVRYAKFSPGLRTPSVPHLFSVAAESDVPRVSWRGLRLASFFEARRGRPVDVRAGQDAAQDFAEFAGKGMTRACDNFAPKANESQRRN